MAGLHGWLARLPRLPMRLLRLFEGFWTVPLALGAAGLLLALLTGPLAGLAGHDAADTVGGWVGPEGGRAALSAVAGGVMSVAGIVFSLTFVALSITAQQLSPRILDYVLRERVTQVLIGLALATFLFATVSLAASDAANGVRLAFAVPIALLLASATLGSVVIFAHSMTRVMRTETMVARLGEAFSKAISRIVEPPEGTVALRLPEGARIVLEQELDTAPEIRAGEAGHVARIDAAGLVALAEERDFVVAVTVRENDHVLPGMVVARVLGLKAGEGQDRRRIAALIELAERRAPSDGADYEAASLSEAALRALSPGINDPATAISCLNRLAEGIAIVAADGPPPEVLGGAGRVARLIVPPRRASDFALAAILPVAVAGQGDYRVRARIAGILAHLETMAEDEAEARALAALAMRIEAREGPEFGA
jgi:uncharacterized membrane protein